MAEIVLTIRWNMDLGKVHVTGPIGMKGLCKDLLKQAEEVIESYSPVPGVQLEREIEAKN